MKRKMFGFIEPQIIMGVVVSLIILGVGVFAVFTVTNVIDDEIPTTTTTTVTNSETFEGDTNESNPSDTWYTYTESGWEWANVTDLQSKSGTQSFRVNTSDGLDNHVILNLTSPTEYEYFEFWFKWDNTSHNFTRYTFLDSSLQGICMVDIGGTVSEGKTNKTAFNNYTQQWNSTELANDTWYNMYIDFNWTTNYVRGRLLNTTATLNDSGWVPMFTGTAVETDIASIVISGYTGQTAMAWFDDFVLYDTSSETVEHPDITGTANSVFGIIGIVLIIGAIFAIIGIVSKFTTGRQ
jgi:hypothetical protein